MRLRAGLGAILLGLTACTHLPEGVRLEARGRAIELKKLCPTLTPPESAPAEADGGQG